MAMIPGTCDECGAIFGAEVLTGAKGSNIQMGGAKVGPCPSCGGVGRVPDGAYDLINNTFRAVQAAGVDKDALNSVIELLESRTEGKVTDEEVIGRVETTIPALAPTIRDYLAKSEPVTWLTLLVSILMLVLQASAASPPSAEEIADAIWAKDREAKMIAADSKPRESREAPQTNDRNRPRKPRARHR